MGTHNAAEYLRQPPVLAIGGSWMVAPKLIGAQDWDAVTRLTAEAIALAARGVRFDLVSLGEVMLRLDPGEGRIRNAARFRVWEGGGEYNVARGLRRCFGLRTAVVTALVDNEIGRLIEDFMLQGGVDTATSSGCRSTASAARSATGSTSPSAASACAARSASPTAATPPQPRCAGGRRLAAAVRRRRRALAPYRRHLRRAV